jgi:hypothetical protein
MGQQGQDRDLNKVEGERHLTEVDRDRCGQEPGPASKIRGGGSNQEEAGCDDYDTKPIEFVRLLDKIENLLGQAAGSTSE